VCVFLFSNTLIRNRQIKSDFAAKLTRFTGEFHSSAIAALAYYAPSYFHKFIVDVLSTIFTRFAHNFPLLRN